MPSKNQPASAITCPRCGLANPGSAPRCDCGYDFETKRIEESYLTRRGQRVRLPFLLHLTTLLGMVWCALGPRSVRRPHPGYLSRNSARCRWRNFATSPHRAAAGLLRGVDCCSGHRVSEHCHQSIGHRHRYHPSDHGARGSHLPYQHMVALPAHGKSTGVLLGSGVEAAIALTRSRGSSARRCRAERPLSYHAPTVPTQIGRGPSWVNTWSAFNGRRWVCERCAGVRRKPSDFLGVACVDAHRR